MKIDESNEIEIVYDNIWTKLGLGNLRGHPVFKGLWRGARVAVVAAALGIAGGSFEILSAMGIPDCIVISLAPMIEKWIREGFPSTEF